VRSVEILHVLSELIPPLLFAAAAWLALRPAGREAPDGGLPALLAFSALVYLGSFRART
jgi:hypothetical protein